MMPPDRNCIALLGLGSTGCSVVQSLVEFNSYFSRKVGYYCLDFAAPPSQPPEQQLHPSPNLIAPSTCLPKKQAGEAVRNIVVPTLRHPFASNAAPLDKELERLRLLLNVLLADYRTFIVVGSLDEIAVVHLVEWLAIQLRKMNARIVFLLAKPTCFKNKYICELTHAVCAKLEKLPLELYPVTASCFDINGLKCMEPKQIVQNLFVNLRMWVQNIVQEHRHDMFCFHENDEFIVPQGLSAN